MNNIFTKLTKKNGRNALGALLFCQLMLVQGCGQKGPLTLPEDTPEHAPAQDVQNSVNKGTTNTEE
ncbi:lipoprotein [Flocculibacter collagenilyticus]|uniref:lipoprotein n=1 Tax=Flocculibacter collagenilyticus TaxID=2744479 RepID=UPI0018F47FE8|nr:lipoprotein [Flocculibacter collagenilyticus]